MSRDHLTCPDCASNLDAAPSKPGTVVCEGGHEFTVPTLLTAQTCRIRALLSSSTVMLDQQSAILLVTLDELDRMPDVDIDSPEYRRLEEALVTTDMVSSAIKELLANSYEQEKLSTPKKKVHPEDENIL